MYLRFRDVSRSNRAGLRSKRLHENFAEFSLLKTTELMELPDSPDTRIVNGESAEKDPRLYHASAVKIFTAPAHVCPRPSESQATRRKKNSFHPPDGIPGCVSGPRASALYRFPFYFYAPALYNTGSTLFHPFRELTRLSRRRTRFYGYPFKFSGGWCSSDASIVSVYDVKGASTFLPCHLSSFRLTKKSPF